MSMQNMKIGKKKHSLILAHAYCLKRDWQNMTKLYKYILLNLDIKILFTGDHSTPKKNPLTGDIESLNQCG